MMELPKETMLVKVRPAFAKSKGCPVFFAAKALIETPRAAYLYGRGTTETRRTGVCMICGRTLTHPVSIALGIGPECGSHFHDWNLIGGYSQENIDRITKAMRDIVVDGWFPKSVFEWSECGDEVSIPADHPMLKKPEKKAGPAKKASQITYQDTNRPGIKIEFPFDQEILTKVKLIPGRRFHNEGYNAKYWTAPISVEAVETLQELEFDLDPKLLEYLDKAKVNVEDMPEMDIPGLKMDLFPYQKKGVAFIEAKDGRALIGDEMGLGKTAQSLAWLQLHPEKKPVVIVVPASLKLNWARECEMWMSNPKVQILSGKKTNTPIVGEIIIINYDILNAWVKVLKGIKPQVLILDEVHKAKNKQTQRTKAVKALGKICPHVIALSGTPIENRPAEIYNAIQMIDPAVAGPWMSFGKRYCDGHHNGFGWQFNGASNVEELHEKLTNTIMIRRKKADVLTDLPAKVRSFVPMEINNWKVYRNAESDFIGWVKKEKGLLAAERAGNAEALAKISALKQLAAEGKMTAAIDWVKDHLDSNGKLVVFAVHKKTIDRLMDELADYSPVKVDGSVSQENRQVAVDTFQNDPRCRVFVGNIQAAGVGLTLTAASSVAFVELPWAPGAADQAEDRIHRIGQTADSVNAYYLLAQGTIEETMARLIDTKRKVLDQVLDGIETDSRNLLGELMEEYAKAA
jgi:SWI/SNF-related matrix-associated actin-dependent regulator of chromatin subfamily A-like protein 1